MKTKKILKTFVFITIFCLQSINIFAQDGTLDSTFGTGGIVETEIGKSLDTGYSVAVQVDGKIVVAGRSIVGVKNTFSLARYNTNGTLDYSFGNLGKVTTVIDHAASINNTVTISVGNSNPTIDLQLDTVSAYSIAIQSDGKILVSGQNDFYEGEMCIIRYNTNGTLDLNFAYDGILTANVGSGIDTAYAMALQSDGKSW